MARKTKTESARTREIILDAAEQAMEQHGVSQTSLASIAGRADLTRGAIYWHFADKTALLEAMIARTHLPLRDLRDELSADQPRASPRWLLREMLVHSVQRLATDAHHRRVAHIVLHRYEANPSDDAGATLTEPFYRQTRRDLVDLCRDIAGIGGARLDAEDATDTILAFVCGLYECVLRHGQLDAAVRNPEAKIDALLDGLFPSASAAAASA